MIEIDHNRALVLSGGGAKGAWQVGVLYYLAAMGHPGFPLVTGTSVGGINGAGLAHFPPDEFAEATAWIKDLWFERLRGNESVYQKRLLGYLRFACCKRSVYSTRPLWALLYDVVDPEKIKASGVELRLTAYDLRSNELHVFDQKTPDIVRAVLATSSFPGMFPPVQYMMGLYTDGGVVDVAPLRQAIKAGADEILVLYTHHDVPPKEPEDGIELAMQVVEAMSTEVLVGDLVIPGKLAKDLAHCETINRLVDHQIDEKHRHVEVTALGPSDSLGDSLDFDPKLTRQRFDLGYEDARRYFGEEVA
jgi:NTE family protein